MALSAQATQGGSQIGPPDVSPHIQDQAAGVYARLESQ